MKLSFPAASKNWVGGIGLAASLALSPVWAQSQASAALSLLPLASVVGVASVGAGASGVVAALPIALTTAGAVLTVKAVQASAQGAVYVLERASDGAQASIVLTGRAVGASAHAVGTAVECSVTATGTVLSVAGEVLAFVPNARGRALLHHERL